MHMTKFNKRVLALAIAGAVALPGAAFAAELEFNGNKQITFARDLIVNDGTTIQTPRDLRFIAQTSDSANLTTVAALAAGRNVTVKVTLTNGARFDTTAVASTLVNGFILGSQFGGDGTTTLGAGGNGTIVGTPFYSTSGQELNFTFTAPADAVAAFAATDFAVELNSFAITNLVQSLGNLGSIDAEITAQNQVGQQILAARTEVANSAWGITAEAVDSPTPDKRIDVANCPAATPAIANRTRFSANGDVGDGCTNGAAQQLFNVGGVTLDITRTDNVGSAAAGDSYINNFNAVAASPQYNVVGTAAWTLTITGSNLAAFRTGDLFLSSSAACASADLAPANTAFNATNTTVTATIPALNALVANLAAASPSPETLYICLQANDGDVMLPQNLSASIGIDYDLPTQRVNPEPFGFDLERLQLNGTTITFQNVNPGGNTRAQSFIRLTNHNSFACPISIDAKDDNGVYTADSNDVITYTIPAQGSWTINSENLENGGLAGTTGAFGDGAGRWYVRVTAQCANVVGSALNRNLDTGVVTNLTTERNNDQNLFGR